MRTQTEIRALCEAEAKRVAKIIGAAAWFDQADKILNEEEKAEVLRRFKAGPGNGTWCSTFLQWLKELPA